MIVMIINKKKRLEEIDFLKGFSIFTIVLMHFFQGSTTGFLKNLFSIGGAGVHIFILCSGFGLYFSYLNKPLGYSQFLRRRLMKVYLPYILIIIISFFIPFDVFNYENLVKLLSHVFLFKMFSEKYENSYGSQMWFVSTIIQFYIIWPLIVYLFKRLYNYNRILPIIIFSIVSLLWATIVALLHKEDIRIWNSFFLQYIWEFVLGMYLAVIKKSNMYKSKLPQINVLLIISIFCLALYGFAGIKGGVWKLYNDVPSMFGYLSMALILYKLSFANSFFLLVNKFSYELFLIHMLVLNIFELAYESVTNMNAPMPILFIFICFVSSFIVAYYYAKLLRKLKWK